MEQNITRELEPIMIVDLAESYGGIETRILEMAKGLHGRKPYTVAVIDGSPLQQRLAAAGLDFSPIRFRKYDPRIIGALTRLIRRDGYRVIDAHNDQSWLWGTLAASLTGVPNKIASVQLHCRVTPGGFKGWTQEMILKLNRWLGGRFLTINRVLVDYISELGVPQGEIGLVYNAIELESFAHSDPPLDVRQLAGWPADSVVFANVARLSPQKAQDTLLEGVAKAVKSHPQIRCLIVGEGRLEAPLKAQATALGINDHVHFTGFRKDVAAILQGSDVFCLPSRAEGLPFALLEACALKMPILVSAVDGMAELFEHNTTAYMVPPDDVERLSTGLIWHVENMDAAREIGVNAHEFVRERLSPEEMVDQTIEFYNT